MSNELRNFLALPYAELEELNLKAKEQRRNRVDAQKIQEERIKYLADEKRIKAVTLLFSDLEGRLHMLDYDKKFLIKSFDNLTFDGFDSRFYGAARERSATVHRLEHVLLGAVGCVRHRQDPGLRRGA
jgi:glutamine synthetase